MIAIPCNAGASDVPRESTALTDGLPRGWGSAAPAGASVPAPRAILPPMPSRDVAAFLRQRPVFAGLPAREIEELATVAVEESHGARAYIFLESDPSRWFYLVKSGHVKIVRHSKTGKDVVLELLGPGEVFGGVAVIEKRPYPAAAQATEPTVVVKIPGERVLFHNHQLQRHRDPQPRTPRPHLQTLCCSLTATPSPLPPPSPSSGSAPPNASPPSST